MKRREFMPRAIAGTAIVAVLPSFLVSCEKEDPVVDDPGNNNDNGDDASDDTVTIDLNDPDFVALKSDGGFAYKDNFIVINAGDENFVALSSVCTHQGCTVNYNSSSNQLPCPCHGSVFATNGTVLNGPANSPLSTFEVSREGDVLTIS